MMFVESFYFFVVIFGATGVWTQGFTLAMQVLYHLSHTSQSFFTFKEVALLKPLLKNAKNSAETSNINTIFVWIFLKRVI
jgi:hypothetical protein